MRVFTAKRPFINGFVPSAGVSLPSSLSVPVCRMARKVGSVAVSPRGDLRMSSDSSAAMWMEQLDRMKEELKIEI